MDGSKRQEYNYCLFNLCSVSVKNLADELMDGRLVNNSVQGDLTAQRIADRMEDII